MAENKGEFRSATNVLLSIILALLLIEAAVQVLPHLCGHCRAAKQDPTAQLATLNNEIDGLATKVTPLSTALGAVTEQVTELGNRADALTKKLGDFKPGGPTVIWNSQSMPEAHDAAGEDASTLGRLPKTIDVIAENLKALNKEGADLTEQVTALARRVEPLMPLPSS